MAQAAYVGVEGVARTITNGYIGVAEPFFGNDPPMPESWKIDQIFVASGEWRPQPNTWYRIHCYGKCADGAKGGSAQFFTSYYFPGNGGAGGGSGGMSMLTSKFENSDTIPITVTTAMTSFGTYCTASAANGATGGTARGGDLSLAGFNGGTAGLGSANTSNATAGSQGGNDGGNGGTIVGNSVVSGGGGGGAKMYQHGMVYAYTGNVMSTLKGGNGITAAGSGAAGSKAPFSATNPISYGGGGGGSGVYAYSSSKNSEHIGGAGGAGSPGFIVIEIGA